MADIEKKTKRYPTDLTDEEWERIRPFLPKPAAKGRKPSVDMREVLNAIRYVARAGCGWRMLPKDFPPWRTVYWWFRRFMRRFLFETIHDVALMIDRERSGREASPSAGVIDSQSVKAREHIEASRWPNGVACPFCGSFDVHRMGGKTQAGMFLCNDCRDKFTCRTGTVMERSHIPLHKWLFAIHLMASSKKGVSAHQLMRNLGIGSYRTAWFLAHRIREAMVDDSHKATGGLGGANKVVEVDETFVGGKAKNRAYREPAPKKAVVSLVEREGRVHSRHVADVTAKTVREIIVTNANRASALMTDDAAIYPAIGREFAGHETVNHSANEYARFGGFAHVNTAENFYSILKRGITGIYHSVSETHLHRYLREFDFRYSNRSGLGIEDAERAAKTLRGVEGKRLTYAQPLNA